jgi:hypothetical protein
VEKGQAEQLLKYLNIRHAHDAAVNAGLGRIVALY